MMRLAFLPASSLRLAYPSPAVALSATEAPRPAPRCRRQYLRMASGAGNDDGQYIDGLSYPPEELEWCTTKDYADDGDQLCCDLNECHERESFGQRVDRAFVRTFRQSSPYINAFSGRVFVIHIPGSIVDEASFGDVMEDIALMRIVGIKLVLVLGPAVQIERRLAAEGMESSFVDGHRVTDDKTLRIVTEASGNLQFEIESKLSRGVVNMPSASRISIVTSNFFSAQPLGVIRGNDYGLTGHVRKFDVETMTRRLNDGDILILRNIAASPSGQLFNCESEEVAGSCAAALGAEKLIFLGSGESLYDKRISKPIPNLTLSSAEKFLEIRSDDLPEHFRRAMTTSVMALNKGVTRAHLLNRAIDGVLLMEIFHRDGVGLMISRDLYEGIRFAALDDVLGIERIIKPLEEQGILVPRKRSAIEQSIADFIVVERDGMIIACLSLSAMGDDPEWAELGCLAVHPNYRRLGKGDSMLAFTERISFLRGVRNLFILSTVTFQWFVERGFSEVDVDRLPQSRQKRYNRERNSKIYFKRLEGSRAVDEFEVLSNASHRK